MSLRVEKMKLSKDKREVIVNPTLTLRGIPPAVFAYRLGNRSALEWVIDQYQVEKDATGQITSDPHRSPPPPEAPRYIVDLVAKVVRVSVRTVELVKSLPAAYGGAPALTRPAPGIPAPAPESPAAPPRTHRPQRRLRPALPVRLLPFLPSRRPSRTGIACLVGPHL